MTGAFDNELASSRKVHPKDEPDPGVVAATSDRPAEAAVIGALLRDETLIDNLADKLSYEDFSDYLFADIYQAILAMTAVGETASAITVARRLATDRELAERGGAKYLAQLAASDSAARGPGYIEHLRELSRRRLLSLALGELRPFIADTAIPLAKVVNNIEAALSRALLSTSSQPSIGFAQAWDAAFERLGQIAAGKIEPTKTISRPREWNELTGGLVEGNFILLGGRPGMGKTGVALTVARGAAEAGHGVLFISREMSVEQLMFRMIADILFEEGSSATLQDVMKGNLSRHDFERAARARRRIDSWPLVFEEPHHLNASSIGPMVRKHKRELGARGVTLALVVVDYLQLLEPPRNRGNREQEVSDISRELKSVARSTSTTMLALSQLSRGVESRDDKRPQLADLRDSGSLEQDADIVVFAYRAQYYLEKSEPPLGDKKRDAWEIDMAAERDRLTLHAAKVRQGASQWRKLYYFGSRQAVRSADYYETGGWAPGL